MNSEFLSLTTAEKLAKYDNMMKYIANRKLILENMLKTQNEDSSYQYEIIGAIKELEILKNKLEVKKGDY